MTRPIDLARVKREASFEHLLAHYGVRTSGSGMQRMALCPFHQDKKPSCSINLERNVFHCFGCGAKGSVLDFVARMENVSIREAAAHIKEVCRLPNEGPLPHVSRLRTRVTYRRATSDQPLQPLPFRLKLDPSHPYLAARGITPELATVFGLGYCKVGTHLQGWICIPVHDEHGVLVAYAGRQATDDVPPGVPKYILPRGFEKRRALFNLHRVAGAEHLILVEGYWSVFRLHTLNLPAVGLMGRVLFAEQQTLLIESGVRRLTLMLDGDRPGREATDAMLPRLATDFFVRVVCLPDRAQPDTVPEEFLLDVLFDRRSS